MPNWVQRFIAAIATHKADVDAHQARSHDHSLAADGSPIAVAGVPMGSWNAKPEGMVRVKVTSLGSKANLSANPRANGMSNAT